MGDKETLGLYARISLLACLSFEKSPVTGWSSLERV